jgi:hypothetical protein
MPVTLSGTNGITSVNGAASLCVAGPAFSAYQSSNQSGFSTNTWTKLNFQTEEFDTNSNYDTTNMRFTPTIAGYYQITACATTTSTSGTTERISIYKNGSIFKAGPNIISYAEGSFVSALIYLNGTTDYVEAYYIFPSTARTISGTAESTYFQGIMVRSA